MWALCNCIQQLLCHFEFLVLVIGDPCPLCDPRLYYYQMTGEECNTCPGYVPLTHFEVVMCWTQKKTGAQLFQRLISTNPGLDFNPRFFFLLIKSILSDNFLFSFLRIQSPNCRQKEFKSICF